MSQENLEVVQRMYDAWNRVDPDGVLALTRPDIELHTSGVFPGLASGYRGHDGVMEFWDSMRSAWEQLTIDVEDVVDVDDRVVVAVRLKAVGRRSGIKADLSFGNVWRVESGLLVSYTSYPSYEQALEAAAARE